MIELYYLLLDWFLLVLSMGAFSVLRTKELQTLKYQGEQDILSTVEGTTENNIHILVDGWLSEIKYNLRAVAPNFAGLLIIVIETFDLSPDGETITELDDVELTELMDSAQSGVAYAPLTNKHVLFLPFDLNRTIMVKRLKKLNIPVQAGQVLQLRYALNDEGTTRSAGSFEFSWEVEQRISPYLQDRNHGSAGIPCIIINPDKDDGLSWVAPCAGRVQNVRMFARSLSQGERVTFGKIPIDFEEATNATFDVVQGEEGNYLTISGSENVGQQPFWDTDYIIGNWVLAQNEPLTMSIEGSVAGVIVEFDFVPTDKKFTLTFNINSGNQRVSTPFDLYLESLTMDGYMWDAMEFLSVLSLILHKNDLNYWKSVNDAGMLGMLTGGPQISSDEGFQGGHEIAKLQFEAESQYSGASKHMDTKENIVEVVKDYIPAGSYFQTLVEQVVGTGTTHGLNIQMNCKLGKILNTPLGNFMEWTLEDEYA